MSDVGDRTSHRVRASVGAALVMLGFLLAFRLVFFLNFHEDARDVPFEQLARAAYLGAKFDLRLALLVTLPLLLLSWSALLDPTRSRFGRRLWLGYFTVSWTAIAFVYFVDFAYYGYLRVRVDASSTEHLEAPRIALEMVWESYPVVWLLLGLSAVVFVYGLVMRAALRLAARPSSARRAGRRATAYAVALLLFALGIYGKLAWYPLRWSEAYATQNPFATAIALNPVLQVADTWENRRASYDLDVVRAHYGEVAAYLGVDAPDVDEVCLERMVRPRPTPSGQPPNVVIVICESLAAFKVGCFGNELDPTPRFDALAREGLLFTRFFVPSGPTARSVFSMITSCPDVNTNGSASRNPLAIRQGTLLTAFEGYRKMYFIGGSANWGNIRGILEHNVPDLRLYEEGDYDAPHNDGWGISDLDLVREANKVFSSSTVTPFVAIIQTAGNHPPWTIPEDHGDFVVRHGLTDEALRDNGFDELEDELNATRFLDYSLGELIELARSEDYFERTIFMFFGDHGLAAPGDHPPFPGLTRHHVPFLIYSPALFPEPRVIDTVASSLDVLPTAVGLTGLGYRNDSLGRDVFDPDRARPPFAFLRFNTQCGLVGEDAFFKFEPDGSEELFEYRSATPLEDVAGEHPETTESMSKLATGLAETARFLLFRDDRP